MHRCEDMVAKGEIAHYEQSLLLSPCFQKLSAAEASESVYMWEKVETNKKELYLPWFRIWSLKSLSKGNVLLQ